MGRGRDPVRGIPGDGIPGDAGMGKRGHTFGVQEHQRIPGEHCTRERRLQRKGSAPCDVPGGLKKER